MHSNYQKNKVRTSANSSFKALKSETENSWFYYIWKFRYIEGEIHPEPCRFIIIYRLCAMLLYTLNQSKHTFWSVTLIHVMNMHVFTRPTKILVKTIQISKTKLIWQRLMDHLVSLIYSVLPASFSVYRNIIAMEGSILLGAIPVIMANEHSKNWITNERTAGKKCVRNG